MSVFRSYIDKQATLIHSNNGNNITNNSLNPIIELSYGGSTNSATTIFSRYIFTLDLNPLLNKINNEGINNTLFTSHILNFSNVISFSPNLIGGKLNGTKRGQGVNIKLYLLTEDFTQGTGYEYIYDINAYNNDINTTAPNWKYRNTNDLWTTSGGSLNRANLLNTQYLELGSEDIKLDITEYINVVLFDNVQNYGFMLCFEEEIEQKADLNQNVITFFSKYTNTFYQPYLQTIINDSVYEDRNKFYFNEQNKLYIQSSKPIYNTSFFNDVDIINHNGSTYTTIPNSSINKVNNYIWYINLNISQNNDRPDLVNWSDNWGVTFDDGDTYNLLKQEFTLFEKNIFEETDDLNSQELWFSFYGIKQNQVISNKSSVKRINVSVKRLVGSSIDNHPTLDDLQYRVYTLQGKNEIDVIPYTDINKLKDNYYFDIDFSWFIPQYYYIQLRVLNNYIEYKNDQIIKFRVVENI